MSETLKTAVTSAFTSVKTDALSLIEDAVPVGLAIMGTVLAITIGVKVFKKLASKA